MIILAIIYKDVRRLWPQVLLFWALLILAAFCDPTYSRRLYPSDFQVVVMALVAACATLIVSLIQQESLPGDRQYWLTRPIPRKSLLCAKAAFLFLSVNVAVLVCHVFILAAFGIPIGENIAALLWRQVFVTTFVVLPAAALAAVTRSLGQSFLVASFVSVLFIVLLQVRLPDIPRPEGLPPDIVVALLSAAGAATVLYLQYSRRRTLSSSVVMAAAVTLLFLSNQTLVYPSAAVPTVKLSLDTSAAIAGGPAAPLGALEIPIRIDGVPPDVDLTVESMQGGIGLPDLTQRWMLHTPLTVIHDFHGGRGWVTVYGGQEEFLSDLNTRVNWYGSLRLVLSTHIRTLPRPGSRGLVVPGIGRCAEEDVSGEITVSCISPMPRTSLALELPNGARHFIVYQKPSSIPQQKYMGFEPLRRFSGKTTFSVTELNDARLIQGDIVGRLDADFSFQGIRLADFLPKHP